MKSNLQSYPARSSPGWDDDHPDLARQNSPNLPKSVIKWCRKTSILDLQCPSWSWIKTCTSFQIHALLFQPWLFSFGANLSSCLRFLCHWPTQLASVNQLEPTWANLSQLEVILGPTSKKHNQVQLRQVSYWWCCIMVAWGSHDMPCGHHSTCFWFSCKNPKGWLSEHSKTLILL